MLRLSGRWDSIFDEGPRAQLEALLPAWLQARRWFAGKARVVRSVAIADAIPISTTVGRACVALVHVEYGDAEPDIYALPLAFATGTDAARMESESPGLVIARTEAAEAELRGVLHDATVSTAFATALLDAIIHGRSFAGARSRIDCSPTPSLTELGIRDATMLAPKLSAAEQSNTSIRFGDRLLLKLFRRPPAGINPDLEIGRMLTARRFPNTPPLVGAIEYRSRTGEERTLGVLHGFVPGAIDGWEFTLAALGRFCEMLRSPGAPDGLREPPPPGLDGSAQSPGADTEFLLGEYLDGARLLARRTAEMHLALAADCKNPGFVPEPFAAEWPREFRSSLHELTARTLALLSGNLDSLGGESRALAAAVIAAEPEIAARIDRLDDASPSGRRIRIHGDYHLGQTLHAGRDFFIVDFEGEPSLPLSERRIKRTPLHDVAGMLRSFDYAAHAALRREFESGAIPAASVPHFISQAERWTRWVSATFIESYIARIGTSDLLSADVNERGLLLDLHLLRKAVYELGYEANNRPDWLPIPCRGILALLGRNGG